MTEPTSSDPIKKPIRSFVRRIGRMTARQKLALELLEARYCTSFEQIGSQGLPAIFGNNHPVILEIGFGDGASLCHHAHSNPQYNYLGVEVHLPGVGHLMAECQRNDVSNLKVVTEDVMQGLIHCIPDNALKAVQLYFPDPWPKKRHHKRRLVQTEWAKLIHQKLQPGGHVHMATDWEPYAEHMMSVFSEIPEYTNPFGIGNYAPSQYKRIETKFERRGIAKGHVVNDLVFVKQPAVSPVLVG